MWGKLSHSTHLIIPATDAVEHVHVRTVMNNLTPQNTAETENNNRKKTSPPKKNKKQQQQKPTTTKTDNNNNKQTTNPASYFHGRVAVCVHSSKCKIFFFRLRDEMLFCDIFRLDEQKWILCLELRYWNYLMCVCMRACLCRCARTRARVCVKRTVFVTSKYKD